MHGGTIKIKINAREVIHRPYSLISASVLPYSVLRLGKNLYSFLYTGISIENRTQPHGKLGGLTFYLI